jgi:hypothetical protein
MDRIGALTDGYKSSSSLKFVLNRDLVGMVLSQLKVRCNSIELHMDMIIAFPETSIVIDGFDGCVS